MYINNVIETSKQLKEAIDVIMNARRHITFDVQYTGKAFNKNDLQAKVFLAYLGLRKWTKRAKKCWTLQRYCTEHIRYIRSFDQAYKDGFNGWECHHVMETMYSMHITAKLLQELDVYEHIPPRYLVFLKKETHTKLHSVNKMNTERYEKWMYDAYLAELN